MQNYIKLLNILVLSKNENNFKLIDLQINLQNKNGLI